jgi:Asp-tRNA(Asn)/Glu-tRNA(Gln) amidotransferase A subunit family amidase
MPAHADLLARLATQRRRIEDLNPRFHAFSHLAEWSEPEVDRHLSASTGKPLCGLSISVKGCIPVRGLPFTEGSAMYRNRVAEHDAEIVALARASGGFVHGTTTLSEFAMYAVRNTFETMGLNPWNVERTAGGSSTGAGVAAILDLADINIGTDAGGSIRNPAIHCGGVGFMPRIGGLSSRGKPNYAPSSGAVGMIARSVELVGRAYAALSADPVKPLSSRRLIVPRHLVNEMCDEATLENFQAALAKLGRHGFTIVTHDFSTWRRGELAAGVTSMAEASEVLAKLDLSEAGEPVRMRAEAATKLAPETVAAAYRAREAFRNEFESVLAEHEAVAVLTPGWPFAAPPINAEHLTVQNRMVPLDPHRNCFVRAANAIGACALSLPSGFYETEQVPAAIHLMAPGGMEWPLIRIAQEIETLMPKLQATPV